MRKALRARRRASRWRTSSLRCPRLVTCSFFLSISSLRRTSRLPVTSSSTKVAPYCANAAITHRRLRKRVCECVYICVSERVSVSVRMRERECVRVSVCERKRAKEKAREKVWCLPTKVVGYCANAGCLCDMPTSNIVRQHHLCVTCLGID